MLSFTPKAPTQILAYLTSPPMTLHCCCDRSPILTVREILSHIEHVIPLSTAFSSQGHCFIINDVASFTALCFRPLTNYRICMVHIKSVSFISTDPFLLLNSFWTLCFSTPLLHVEPAITTDDKSNTEFVSP